MWHSSFSWNIENKYEFNDCKWNSWLILAYNNQRTKHNQHCFHQAFIFSCISGFWHPHPCIKVLTPYFSCISGLRHPNPYTKVLTPCFSRISGLRHPDLCVKVTTPCFSYISGSQHPNHCTKVSTPCLSCLSQGFYAPPRFYTLFSPY